MKLAFALAAAAGLLLAAPTFTAPAAAEPTIKLAQADVRVRVGAPVVRRKPVVVVRTKRVVRPAVIVAKPRCSTTVVIRNGKRTVIKRCP